MVTNSEGQVYTGDPAAVPVISQIAIPEGTTAGTGADFSASGSAVVFSQETPTIGAVLMADLTGNTVTTLLDESGGEVSLRSNGSVYVSTTGSNSLTVFGEDLATNYPVSMASALTGSLSGKGYVSGAGNSNEQVYARFTGLKQYELKDHLGNVRGVVSDLKTATGTGNVPTNDAKVLAYYNYYPFGLQMHGRYNPTDPAGKGGYRFGFNGKEKDDDFNGSIGTIYDYGFRIYDSRIAKFLSVDPLTKEYPWYTPYQFAGNTPIQAIDVEGLEGVQMVDHQSKTTTIFVNFVYSPPTKTNKNNNTGFSRKQMETIVQGINEEFSKGKFVDKNHTDKNGNFYQVLLKINLIEGSDKRSVYAEVNKSLNQTSNLKADIVVEKTKIVSYSVNGGIATKPGSSITGILKMTDPTQSHTNTHELFHDLIHNHPNANLFYSTLINPTNQEPGHLTAGGIFVYKNEVTGVKEQDLNQKNIDDALNVLPEIEFKVTGDSDSNSILGNENSKEL